MAKITSEGFLTVTANVQPGYKKDLNQQNPFWNSYKLLYTGSSADDFNRANNYILSKFQSNNDGRYKRVFSSVPNSTNYVGFNYGEVIPNAPIASASSNVAGPGLAISADQDQWVFTSVESKFLQAEAAVRGWLPDDAQAAYKAAVTESFVWLGLDTTAAAAYLGQPFSIVTWPSAQADQIKTVVMQKYLALIGINNFEAWVDYRRVGVPADLPLSLHPSRGSNVIPLRYIYPQSEYSYNAAVVKAQGTINPQTDHIFWDVN
jgi:hypothetical protein